MTEIDRVRQMVKDGRITEAEGQQLIEVLKGAQAADDELQAADQQIVAEAKAAESGMTAPVRAAESGTTDPTRADQGQPRAPLPPVNTGNDENTNALPGQVETPTAPVPPPPPATAHVPVTPVTPPPARSAPGDTRWVRLQMLAGDLEVKVDETLEEPVAECDGPADVVIERSQNGFNVRWDHPGGSFLDKVLGKIKSGDVNITLPKGFGLDLAATAGNVELHGVPYLRGSMTAGNLEAKGLKGIDFTGRAGDIEADLELTEGNHRINVTAGNIKVRLARGSSVALNAHASIGDIRSRIPGISKKGRGLGEELTGNVGGDAAKLELNVTTGNLELEVENG